MKKMFLIAAVLLFPFALSAQKVGDTVIANNPANLKLKVYYFHITHRCNTCMSIEQNLRKTIDSCFSAELASGVIELYIMNCELPENQELVKKYDAYGSTLAFSAFVNGAEQKPEDITGWAFQKAHDPKLFVSELKSKIVEHLK